MAQKKPTLTELPSEIFENITKCLPLRDKLALAVVSKAAYTLTQGPIYSCVILESASALDKLKDTLALKPGLASLVRTLATRGDGSWECLDVLRSCDFLQSLIIQLDDACRTSGTPIAEAVADFGAGSSCKECHIVWSGGMSGNLSSETGESILWNLMSAPKLEAVTACFIAQWRGGTFFREEDELYSIQPRELPTLTATKLTSLRELRLRWDRLPLPWLSALLRLPQCLEVLILEFSLQYPMYHPDVTMDLDVVFEPVSDTLRTLIIVPVDTIDDITKTEMEDRGLKWSRKGLSAFSNLEHLGLPSSSLGQWIVYCGSLPLRLPASLITINLTDAKLLTVTNDGWNHEMRALADEMGHSRRPLTLNPAALDGLVHLSTIVHTLPRLVSIGVDDYDYEISGGRHNYPIDMRRLQNDLPPVLIYEETGALVDRGITAMFWPKEDVIRLLPTTPGERRPRIWRYGLRQRTMPGLGTMWDKWVQLPFRTRI